MDATLSGNKILLTFRYNPMTIDRVKLIVGREWNPESKTWSIPYTDENVRFIKEIGFNTSFIDEQIKKDIDYKLEIINKLTEEIKKDYSFLYDFQIDVVIKGIMCDSLLIALDMGLGKTICSLAIADYRIKHKQAERVLVICPNSIKFQWKEQARDFFKLDFAIIEGTTAKRKKLWESSQKYVIISYELLLQDFDCIYKYSKNQIVIFDEASFLKNEKAQRTKKASLLKAKYRLLLTGTPVEIKLQDALTIGNITTPDWMNWKEFSKNYIVWGENDYGHFINGYKNIDLFMKRLMEIGIRKKKEDVKEMPGKIKYVRMVDLDKEQLSVIEIIKQGLREDLKENPNSVLGDFVFMSMCEDSTELLKKSDAFKKYGVPIIKNASPKIEELIKVIEESSDKKIVIFSKYKNMVEIIKRELDKANLGSSVIGSGDTIDRGALIKDFQTNHRFLIVTDSFSYGIDIPFATMLINFDIHPNPAKMKQREDRIYRITSKEQVKIVNLVSKGFESIIWERVIQRGIIGEEAINFNLKEQMIRFIMG